MDFNEAAKLLFAMRRGVPGHLAAELNDGTPASFVLGLHNMLTHESCVEIVNGQLYVDSETLEIVLPKYYKHNNAKSFFRQLYNFGFVRRQDAFVHPILAYGDDLLLQLKRKRQKF